MKKIRITKQECEYDVCDICGADCAGESSYLCHYKGYNVVATADFCIKCSETIVYPWLESQKIKPTV